MCLHNLGYADWRELSRQYRKAAPVCNFIISLKMVAAMTSSG